MASIQEKLKVLANTMDRAESLSSDQLSEEKKNLSIVDYKMVTFSLSGKAYAIDIMNVKEIAKASHFTYVPNTLHFVRGVYNLRGDIIPIIDLRLFFNSEVEEKDDNYLENMLIVTVDEQIFGIIVDKIDKVVGIQKSSIQPPHPLFGDINIKYIYGVVEAENNLYVLLDLDKIFGVKTPEEEKELAETAQRQAQQRRAVAMAEEAQLAAAKQETPAVKQKAAPEEKKTETVEKKAEGEAKKAEVDLNFIAGSLNSFRKFTVSSVTEKWTKQRYEQWLAEKGEGKTQLQTENDVDDFLKPFYSKCNNTWWTKDYAESVEKVLPENTAKNIVVWNPGCGRGYEAYSLACILTKKYPNAKIKIYGHDTDLLAVSNAPLMNLSAEASSDWYSPYVARTISGDSTFVKDIKDSILFEYHDCANTNNLPPVDIIFARDLLSFLPENIQNKILQEFSEKIKGNGVIIVGDNENIEIDGWNRSDSEKISVYSK